MLYRSQVYRKKATLWEGKSEHAPFNTSAQIAVPVPLSQHEQGHPSVQEGRTEHPGSRYHAQSEQQVETWEGTKRPSHTEMLSWSSGSRNLPPFGLTYNFKPINNNKSQTHKALSTNG